jgi:hypothetical protein
MSSNDTTPIDALLKKVEELEKLVNNLKGNKVEYNITIHDVHVNDPVIKELSYHLDKLDIKELSGQLNMGNNFSPKTETKNKPKPKKTEEKKQQTKKPKEKPKPPTKKASDEEDNIVIIFNHKRTPYSIVKRS